MRKNYNYAYFWFPAMHLLLRTSDNKVATEIRARGNGVEIELTASVMLSISKWRAGTQAYRSYSVADVYSDHCFPESTPDISTPQLPSLPCLPST